MAAFTRRFELLCSPRTRGCSRRRRPSESPPRLLPAHAGMFPQETGSNPPGRSAPRARGDVPSARSPSARIAACSPRTRGCSQADRTEHTTTKLLPVHAGMFPTRPGGPLDGPTAPRARGDVPRSLTGRVATLPCSPCTRGCSQVLDRPSRDAALLPVHAGMFPSPTGGTTPPPAAPRARGDVPRAGSPTCTTTPCSPCTRGCSPHRRPDHRGDALLPVHTGMFPPGAVRRTSQTSAPRARGDVPDPAADRVLIVSCSPCTRGCSPPRFRTDPPRPLLPAHAGMFPTSGHSSAEARPGGSLTEEVDRKSAGQERFGGCGPREGQVQGDDPRRARGERHRVLS